MSGGDSTYEGGVETIHDGPPPAPEPAAPPAATPPAEVDAQTTGHQTSFRLASQTQASGTAAYARGLRSYWDGNMSEAIAAFDAASAAEPENALYQYYRALAYYNVAGPEGASDWLAQAVEAERQAPVKNWGKSMERVQGSARLWIERARTAARIGR
jgi:tetratricopeptide (TPR) repeat protein